MIRWILCLTLLASAQAFGCSFCRQNAAAAAAAGNVGPTVSTTSPDPRMPSGPMRVVAAKAAIDMNAPIILGMDRQRAPVSERGTFQMEVPTSEIYGN